MIFPFVFPEFMNSSDFFIALMNFLYGRMTIFEPFSVFTSKVSPEIEKIFCEVSFWFSF